MPPYPKIDPRTDPAIRFWTKVEVPDYGDVCWEWRAVCDKYGYGRFAKKSHMGSAHRYAYELAWGSIDSGAYVLHKCDNPPCVNPHHLYLGNQSINLIDSFKRGRYPTRLTPNQVHEIRLRIKSGEIQKDVAKDFDIGSGHISLIINRKIWTWVD